MRRRLFVYSIIHIGFLSLQLNAQTGANCENAKLLANPGQYTVTYSPSALSTWYKYIANNTGVLSINSCGNSSVDTYIKVHQGNCDALELIAENDDNENGSCLFNGASYLEEVILIEGNTYYFEWVNDFVSTNYNWSFTFIPLPKNFDIGIRELTNRYTQIPINQTTNGIKLGGIVKNLSANNITNLVLKSEIYELPDTIKPIQSFSSAPTNLKAGKQIELVSGTWIPIGLNSSRSYQIKYIKTQDEIDEVSINDSLVQNLTLDFNYMARDNNKFLTTLDYPALSGFSQGSKFMILKDEIMTGIDFYVAPGSIPQNYTIEIFSITNGIINSNSPVYNSGPLSEMYDGWNNFKFISPLNVIKGEYLIAITNQGQLSFPLGCSEQIFTKGTNLFREGGKLWLPIEIFGNKFTFMIRPKLGPDISKDIKFISNKNPGGAYTQIHSRQSTNGNDLVFSAKGKNVGTEKIVAELIISVKNSQGTTIYSDSSSKQELNPGDTGTFSVPSYLITEFDDYKIEYNFFAQDDQAPQNNVFSTEFSRTKNRMSRAYGVTGSFGIGDNQTLGVYDNGIIGQTYKLDFKDYLDSVEFVLNQKTPANQSIRVQIFKTNSEGIPEGEPIAKTINYVTTSQDSIAGVIVKIPIEGGSYSMEPGTYFFGINENAGDIKLAYSSFYYSPKTAFVKWDQNPSGSDIWTPLEELNKFVSLLINPLFQICVPLKVDANVIDEVDGNDGAVNLSVSGGLTPYSFIWNDNQKTEDISGLNSGTYSFIITDANGCSLTDSVVVNSVSAAWVVSPNPGYDLINVQTFKDGEILFYDLNGKITYSAFIIAGKNTIDVSKFKGGIYLIRHNDEVKKWIKQ